MADNFNEFLDGAEAFEDVQMEEADVTGGNFVCNDEVKSVLRFKSPENSPPSLSSLSIIRLCSRMNEISSNLANRKEDLTSESVNLRHEIERFQKLIQLLPEDLLAKVMSQLSFTALKSLYKNKVWTMDPLVVAASIKQEEDMLRYLYWKDPTNPLLGHFEESLVLDVFADKSILPLLNTKHLAPTDKLKEALVQAYLEKKCFNHEFSDKEEFINDFHEMTNGGCLRDLNWNNVLIVGGSVLGSFRREIQENPNPFNNPYSTSDIDIYLYGLSKVQSQAKVEEIYNTILKSEGACGSPIGIFKTANTITLVSQHGFRNIQIILSTYASPLEILLASDMNSCSIGFNGQTILTIPRFIFGALYGSNILDSSTKFGTKLRWERLAKYYHRGYNIVSPLHIRVHGHGSFNLEERIDHNIHPSTRQLIELMCLNKIALLRISFGRQHFGTSRESEFDRWPTRWTRGITILKRCFLTRWDQTEYKGLLDLLPNPPAWVKSYYKKAQNLTLPEDSIREAPRYSENTRTVDDFSWRGKEAHHFNPNKNKDIHRYVTDYCKFDNYNESSLQCFHLNFFVDKEQKDTNPYKEMNTSLATLRYTLQTVPVAIKNFDKFLSGEIRSLSSTFQVNSKNWKLSFEWASNAISFIKLTKEADEEEDKMSFNNTQSHPTKFFANFLLRLKSLKTVALTVLEYDTMPKDVTFDGSQVFTYNQPSNTWLTWIHNNYFRGQLNPAAEDWLAYTTNHGAIDARPRYIDSNGTVNWEVTLQLIEPQFHVTNV